jgi:hypothetical protein
MTDEYGLTPEFLERMRLRKEASRLEAERRRNIHSTWMSDIYWSVVLRDIARYTDEFKRIAARDSVLKFPDGSICINVQSDFMDAFKLLQSPVLRTGGTDADGNVCGRISLIPHTAWRALKCFPVRYYSFSVPAEYLERIGGEMSLMIAPTDLQDRIEPGEHNPADLSVGVRFWRKLPASERPGFEAALAAWEKSLCEEHALGAAHARLKPGTLGFANRDVNFRIDASGGNQDVLNWLVISIVNFGVEKHPVAKVRFGELA